MLGANLRSRYKSFIFSSILGMTIGVSLVSCAVPGEILYDSNNPVSNHFETRATDPVIETELATVSETNQDSENLPEGVSENWLAEAQKYIRDSEYHIKPYQQTSGVYVSGSSLFQAPNRAHDLRTYFEEDGIRVVPRSGEQSWEWGFNAHRLRSTG